MNVDQLESFLYVAATGSFSKAGELLFLTQPSVSLRVQSLENYLGTPLFERSGKHVNLTQEGRSFLPFAEKIIQHMNDGKLAIQSIRNAVEGELFFSCVITAATYLLPPLMAEFLERHPKVKLNIRTGHSDQVLDMVLNCEIPFGISRSVSHSQIESTHLIDDTMELVVSPQHPFSKLTEVTPEQIAQQPFILFNRGSHDWQLVKESFDRLGLGLNIVMEVDSFEVVKQMIKEQVGIAILSHTAIQKDVANNLLQTVPIANFPSIKRHFEIIHLKSKQVNGIAKMFTDFLVSRLQKQQEG